MSILRAFRELTIRVLRRIGHIPRSWLRCAGALVLALLLYDFLLTVAFHAPANRVPPIPVTGTHDAKEGEEVAKAQKIFIASLHFNDAPLLRSHWSPAILDLVRHFGAANVYVSILEGGSWDDTKAALRELDGELGKLGVERNIEMEPTTHEDEVKRVPREGEQGWIHTERQRGPKGEEGKKELRRVPYLAGKRNKVMEKLEELKVRRKGKRKRFDWVLWVNDVIFNTEDVTTLMATRDGNFSAACALDYSIPGKYYDSFALRDIQGNEAFPQTWPYFLAPESRKAMMSNQPVPVKSCWNGLVLFPADRFYRDRKLKFRGIPDSLAQKHLEGSECCLIHADGDDREMKKRGVWVNPNVRVGYNEDAWRMVNPVGAQWPGKSERVWGIWRNRLARWMGGVSRKWNRWRVNRRVRKWREGERGREENGEMCIVDETQVLVNNGWQHLE